jgi:hypothetical protein
MTAKKEVPITERHILTQAELIQAAIAWVIAKKKNTQLGLLSAWSADGTYHTTPTYHFIVDVEIK